MSGTQVVSLVIGVLIGTVGTFVANEISDRARVRRNDRIVFRNQRLEAYSGFAQAVKATQRLISRRGSALGNGPNLDPLTSAEAKPLFMREYDRQDEQFELMMLFAPRSVQEAAREWVKQLGELRGMVDAEVCDPAQWHELMTELQGRRAAFHAAARADTDVPDITPRRWWERRPDAPTRTAHLQSSADRYARERTWTDAPDGPT